MAIQPLTSQIGRPEQLNIGGALIGGQQDYQRTQGMKLQNQINQQNIDDGDFAVKIRNLQIMNALAKKAMTIPPEQRNAFAMSQAGVLKSIGLPADQIASAPMDDASLQQYIGQSDSILTSLMPAKQTQQKTPSSVAETEWFLRQPKEVQDEHIRLKRKTDPTMAEKLQFERDKSDIAINEAKVKEEQKLRTQAASEAVDKVMSIESGLSLYDNLINEIDNGASTSVFESWAPSIKDSTRRFEQGARELGLGVISNTTFGALSEGEMRLAMETAVPKLGPEAMRQWLMDKKAAQQKLADSMYEYATFLEEGGSKAQWLKMQREIKANRPKESQRAAGQPSFTGQDKQSQPEQNTFTSKSGIKFQVK